MANYLRASMLTTVLKLHEQGWSGRRIARELRVNRRTVSKYISMAASKRAISTTGFSPEESPGRQSKRAIPTAGASEGVIEAIASERAISTTGSAGRKSLCANHHEYISERVNAGCSAQRIHQDLKIERGFEGSYESVKRYTRKHFQECELPFRRLETPPGAEVQVDYGTGAKIIDSDGKKRKTHLFRIVLSCSRKAYSEVTRTQSTESFIRALENAFRHFGGAPETIVIDNLKAGVKKACFYDPDLNPKLQDFAAHYNTCVLPCKVATPRHKGKVESSVKYVQSNALKGREFRSIQEQNAFLIEWEKSVADTRIHGTVKKQVKKMFDEEKPFLRPLPEFLFPAFEESTRKVHLDGHIEVGKAYYSVPHEYLRREVRVRFDLRMVRIFTLKMKHIATHARLEPGLRSTHDGHVPLEKISNPERGNEWLLRRIDRIGGPAGEWSRSMLKKRGIQGTRVLNGLLQVADKYTGSSINKACEEALKFNRFKLGDLKNIIKDNYQMEQQEFTFLENHPLIREVAEYETITQSKECFA